MPAIERPGLWTADVEILRLHYADTLTRWRQRFYAHRDEAKAIYDERFCRMWEIYLIGTEAGFSWQDLWCSRSSSRRRNDTVPLTRDYIEKCEKALAMHEIAHQPAQTADEKPKRSRRKVGERK